jgi:hypothetical protein
MSKKPNPTLLGTHFDQKRPDQAWLVPPADYPIPTGRRHLPRLTWQMSLLKQDWTAEGFARTVMLGTMPGTQFFLDTNFLSAPLDDVAWHALLLHHVAIAPLIRTELGAWLSSGRNAMMAQAVNSKHAHISYPEIDSIVVNNSYEYYINILGFRKYWGAIAQKSLTDRLGRSPTQEEFASYCKKLTKDRGYDIAAKAKDNLGKSNFLADEQLVVMAVLTAIITGRETVILTRDRDVFDQFYKLIYIIDINYISMLFADHYTAFPNEFHTRRIVDLVQQDSQRRFTGGNDDILVWPKRQTPDYLVSILPPQFEPVTINCIWFAGGPSQLKASMLIFCAEKEMGRLLGTKYETNGLNTRKLGETNCHIHAYPDIEDFGGMAAIARDRTISTPEAQTCIVDLLLSLLSVEGYRTFTESDIIASPTRIK